MEDHERCQHLVALQNSRLERFDNTRKIQWNFNGIFWTGLIVAIAFFLKETKRFWIGDLIFISSIISAIHGTIIYMIQESLRYDKDAVDRYRIPAEQLLGLPDEPAEKLLDRKWKWFGVQIGITIVLLLIATLLLMN